MKKSVAILLMSLIFSGCINFKNVKHYKRNPAYIPPTATDTKEEIKAKEKVPKVILEWQDTIFDAGTKGSEYARKGDDISTKNKDVADHLVELVEHAGKTIGKTAGSVKKAV